MESIVSPAAILGVEDRSTPNTFTKRATSTTSSTHIQIGRDSFKEIWKAKAIKWRGPYVKQQKRKKDGGRKIGSSDCYP